MVDRTLSRGREIVDSYQRQRQSTVDYYRSDVALTRPASEIVIGLNDLERRAIARYFTECGASVLDLGCGVGRTTKPLDDAGFDVVGVDLTEPLVARARSLFPRTEFVCGDASSLPFDDGEFEYVLFSSSGIDHIYPESKRYATLEEIRRVMNPGGTFAVNTANVLRRYAFHPLKPESVERFVRFWAINVRDGNLRSKYKQPVDRDSTVLYHSRPSEQRRQLADVGFDVLDVLRYDERPFVRQFTPHIYVVRKPG